MSWRKVWLQLCIKGKCNYSTTTFVVHSTTTYFFFKMSTTFLSVELLILQRKWGKGKKQVFGIVLMSLPFYLYPSSCRHHQFLSASVQKPLGTNLSWPQPPKNIHIRRVFLNMSFHSWSMKKYLSSSLLSFNAKKPVSIFWRTINVTKSPVIWHVLGYETNLMNWMVVKAVLGWEEWNEEHEWLVEKWKNH